MLRNLPATWTAIYMALAGLATWLLCETDALEGAVPLFFH